MKILSLQIGNSARRFCSFLTISSNDVTRLDQADVKGIEVALLFALFAFFDQLPEPGMFAQLVVFGHRQLGTEEKISDRVLMENPVDKHAFRASLKIDAIVAGPVTIEPFSFPLDDSEHFRVQVRKVVGQELELRQEFELKVLRDTRYLSCADLVENDLIHRPCSRQFSE